MLRIILCTAAVIALAAAVSSPAGAQTATPNQQTNGGKIMKHELPPLPYAYNALEPYYDEETVRLHHDKHQAGYVAGWNKAEEALERHGPRATMP